MKKNFGNHFRSAIALPILLFCFSAAFPCHAQAPGAPATKGLLDDEPIITHHNATLQGHSLSYTARTGYLSIRDEEQVVHGRIFYVSYTLDQPATAPPRPLLFAWNGGPGANASLLELGALGPRSIQGNVNSANPRLRPELVDNEDTWLQFADLVFVDPINTGYSYATAPEYLKEFLNDQGDADAMAEFIRLYRSHFELQRSPLFLAGESYGTYRAVGVAEILAHRDIPLNGIMLLSTTLNPNADESPDLSAVFLLPNYAATAFVHHRLAPNLQADLEQTINEVQHWAESDYLAALSRGDRLAPEQKAAIAQKLARYTSVGSDLWVKNGLILLPDQFAQEVLGSDKLEYVGHYDTRIIGKLTHKGEPYNVSKDPSLDNGVHDVILGYLRNELGWKIDALYAGPFGGRWPSPTSPRADWTAVRWDKDTDSYPDRGKVLAEALRSTPDLRVIIASGYYDFSTPFAATEYAVSHLNLDPELRKRISFVRYQGGHAAYMDPKVRVRIFQDMQAFITATPATQ
jgi:carboxypeptidase C (cathepsin A)